MRRASASIPSNIAEGCGRGSNADFSRFLQLAMGSAMELDYQLLLASHLGYVAPESYDNLRSETLSVRRMLSSLIRKIQGER
jgi:four helix bundle protein